MFRSGAVRRALQALVGTGGGAGGALREAGAVDCVAQRLKGATCWFSSNVETGGRPAGAAASARRLGDAAPTLSPALSSQLLHPPPPHRSVSTTAHLLGPPRVSEPLPASPALGADAASPPSVSPDHQITVKAFYIAQRLDLAALARNYETLPMSKHRDSLIVSLASSASVFPYVAVTGYGSVVFFDVTREAQEEFLAHARAAAVKLLPQPCADDLRVAVRPSLAGWSKLAQDTLELRALDTNNLRVVSSVLAQSVALSHFEQQVDALLEIFTSLNADMERTAGALRLPRERLFQLVAQNNNILTDVIARVGLLSRSDAAWAAQQYHEVFSALRADFELDDRFENLHFKLDLIGKQLHFNLDILQNRKSDSLEWIIIVLISVEIVVSAAGLAMGIAH